MRYPKIPMKIVDSAGNKLYSTLDVKNEDYSGGGDTKRSMRGWITGTGDADSTSNFELSNLRHRSHDLYRNTPIASAAIDRPLLHVIGQGLILQSQIDRKTLNMNDEQADEWEDNVERKFHAWANNPLCDLQEHYNFYDNQGLALLSMFLGGDCFTLLPIKPNKNLSGSLRINIYEADYVSNPSYQLDSKNLVKGVELNNDGAATGYHFSDVFPGNAMTMPSKWTLIKKYGVRSGRRQVIHLFKRKRPNQHRGIPFLHAIMEPLKQLTRFSDSELMSAIVSSFFTVFVKQETPSSGSILEEAISTEQQVTGGLDSSIYEMGNGNIVGLGQNESVDFADPKTPNGKFEPFHTAFTNQIGAALGIPYEVLMLKFQSSYSASRAALLEAWTFFKTERTFISRYWCSVVYAEWLKMEIMSGRISAPNFLDNVIMRDAWSGSSWIGPGMGMLDPVKETNAALARIDGRLSNHEREYSRTETGNDWRAVTNKLARENDFLESKGLKSSGVRAEDSGNEDDLK